MDTKWRRSFISQLDELYSKLPNCAGLGRHQEAMSSDWPWRRPNRHWKNNGDDEHIKPVGHVARSRELVWAKVQLKELTW